MTQWNDTLERRSDKIVDFMEKRIANLEQRDHLFLSRQEFITLFEGNRLMKNNIGKFYPAHWQAEGYGTEQSDAFQKEIFRNMFPGYEDYVRNNSEDFDRVLDVGCGDATAAIAFFGEVWQRLSYTGIDPSGVLPAYENLRRHGKYDERLTRIVQTDMFAFDDYHSQWNWVFCVGVLHYLDDMQRGLERLAALLRPGGTMVLWVYRKQKPIRELTDNYLRSYFSAMSPENARKAIEGLTNLGMSLGAIKERLHIEDIPELGIEAGEYSLHEFFYYFIMKLFYHPKLPFERHVVNNWNAFYPSPVTFVEPGRLHNMLTDLRLECELFHEHGNGIGVIAVKCP